MIWFLSWVVWVEKKWSLLWCPDHVPQSYPVTFGGNPMMLDLKNVCLAAKTTNGNSGTLSWGSGFVPDFVILLCIVSERCFIRTLPRGVGAKDFSWILKGPDTRSRNLYGKVLTKHIFCQNWKSINIWNIAIRNCWPKIFMWEIHTSKRHVPIKRNLWSSKQSTQSLDEKSRFVVSHPAPPILLHRFVKKFGGPTPKRWWFVVSGHDQPRLMGVVLGHRSFPGSIYIFEDSTLKPEKMMGFESWKLPYLQGWKGIQLSGIPAVHLLGGFHLFKTGAGLSILSWSAPASDGSTPITGYRVQRRTARG